MADRLNIQDLLKELESKLNYNFKNIELLKEALTHKSFVNENPELEFRDNERLEFLGDAVLNLSISTYLIHNFPDFQEGELSKIKSIIVSEQLLSRVAIEIDIGHHLLLGKGEDQSGGRKKESLLANALEAIIAAIYLDGGFEAADDFLKRIFSEYIKIVAKKKISFDYKTDLQEYCQAKGLTLPVYNVIKEIGPDHMKVFEVELLINGKRLGTGRGRSKKDAEQIAAREALKHLTNKF